MPVLKLFGPDANVIGEINLSSSYIVDLERELPTNLRLGYSWTDHNNNVREITSFQILNEPAEEKITISNKEGEILGSVPTNTDVYVAHLLPFPDGSGEARVLGVFETKVEAEACCYRTIIDIGYQQPTEIITCQIGKSNTPNQTERLYKEALKAMAEYEKKKCSKSHEIVANNTHYMLLCNGVTFAAKEFGILVEASEIEQWRQQMMENHNA